MKALLQFLFVPSEPVREAIVEASAFTAYWLLKNSPLILTLGWFCGMFFLSYRFRFPVSLAIVWNLYALAMVVRIYTAIKRMTKPLMWRYFRYY